MKNLLVIVAIIVAIFAALILMMFRGQPLGSLSDVDVTNRSEVNDRIFWQGTRTSSTTRWPLHRHWF